jgi:hypothetical protein
MATANLVLQPAEEQALFETMVHLGYLDASSLPYSTSLVSNATNATTYTGKEASGPITDTAVNPFLIAETSAAGLEANFNMDYFAVGENWNGVQLAEPSSVGQDMLTMIDARAINNGQHPTSDCINS